MCNCVKFVILIKKTEVNNVSNPLKTEFEKTIAWLHRAHY